MHKIITVNLPHHYIEALGTLRGHTNPSRSELIRQYIKDGIEEALQIIAEAVIEYNKQPVKPTDNQIIMDGIIYNIPERIQ